MKVTTKNYEITKVKYSFNGGNDINGILIHELKDTYHDGDTIYWAEDDMIPQTDEEVEDFFETDGLSASETQYREVK